MDYHRTLMLYLDYIYAKKLDTVGLRNFKELSPSLWRFSCPYCGDSKRNQLKARGFIFQPPTGDALMFKCHNGCPSKPLQAFLNDMSPNLYHEYKLELLKLKSGFTPKVLKESKVEHVEHKIQLESLPNITRITDLPQDHKAVKYIFSRRIPTKYLSRFFYTEEFKAYSNTIKPGAFQNTNHDHPRIIIPMYTSDGKIFAYQGRSINGEEPKYLTIKLDESHEKIFGLESVDFSKDFYVTEGFIDSIFIDNALAVAGGAVSSKIIEAHKKTAIIVFDSEPRNKEICRQIEKSIECGYRVVLLPKKYRSRGKDINALIMSGMTKSEVMKAITENVYQGLTAKLKFSTWGNE